jgi:N utilization substance protein B
MASRREARRRAVDILYEADLTGADTADVMVTWKEAGREIDPFTRELVEGVASHLPEIDALLGRVAEEWTVERMASVDRAILRVACFELLHLEEVPTAVAIDEAVEAAKTLSTEDSGRFVNGILGRIARQTRESA